VILSPDHDAQAGQAYELVAEVHPENPSLVRALQCIHWGSPGDVDWIAWGVVTGNLALARNIHSGQ
jgi:hypothetical protein